MTAAPLVATAEAPVPPGARAFWYAGAGGARLRAAIFAAAGESRGSVVLSAGRTEPIEKYFEVIAELQGRGLVVLAHDWRGQGLSHRILPDPMRGHADGHADFLEDFRLLLAQCGGQLPRPWIGLGHSMGGCLSVLAATKRAARFDGLFLSAPMMGVAQVRHLPRAVAVLARALVGLGRGGDYIKEEGFDPMLGPFEGNVLTHDERRYNRYKDQLAACPQLALGAVTWGWLGFALDASAELARASTAKAATMPLTVVAAGDERLVLNGPSCRFARRAPQGRYAEIAGAFHEVLMETDARRELVWREFDALASRIAP
jgi:alpha-beta hydrolase superfamily lysophospholipase